METRGDQHIAPQEQRKRQEEEGREGSEPKSGIPNTHHSKKEKYHLARSALMK